MVERWKLRYQKYHQMTNFVCFTGDLKDKRNKVIPLEENPTTTTATLAPWTMKQLSTGNNVEPVSTSPTWGPTLFIFWCGTFRLFWLQTSKSPSIPFLRCQSKTAQGSNQIVHQAPVSLQQRPHRAALKKELPVITKFLYLFLHYAGLHWLARAVNAVCPDQSSTTTQSWAGRLHCRLIVFNYNPPTCLAALYR